ncbi:MAG TPA: S-layer homology domain-containing protein [Thermotogota bacterium]|nr:S-layer homology domain-containing protein [Thermotogota bacterium]HPR96446.1 S-layer homology domain-containing protein [Thermotogota bacterium]
MSGLTDRIMSGGNKAPTFKWIAAFFIILTTGSLMTAAPGFTDLPSSHWAYESVMFLAENGIISGLPDGTFSGSEPMTRYQSAVAMKRLVDYLQSGNSAGTSTVSDIRIRELEELMRRALNAVESAGRDYRDIKERLEGYSAGTSLISYEDEIQRIEDSVTVVEKRTEKNADAILTNETEIQRLRSEFEQVQYDRSNDRQMTLDKFEEMESQMNALRWTTIGGIVIGIAGVVMASFALGK